MFDAFQPGKRHCDHFLVHKKQRGERLVLGRSRDVALDRKVIEKRGDLRRTEFAGMAPAGPARRFFPCSPPAPRTLNRLSPENNRSRPGVVHTLIVPRLYNKGNS